MPAYGASAPNTASPAGILNTLTLNPVPGSTLVMPGEYAYVWGTYDYGSAVVTQENTPANGTASKPVCADLGPGPGAGAPLVDVEIVFAANPGAINLQVQCADTDADAAYLTPGNAAFTITAVVQKGALYVATASFSPTQGPFLRLLATTITTPTTWQVKFRRR